MNEIGIVFSIWVLEWGKIIWHRSDFGLVGLVGVVAHGTGLTFLLWSTELNWIIHGSTGAFVLSVLVHRTRWGTYRLLPWKNCDLFHLFSALSSWSAEIAAVVACPGLMGIPTAIIGAYGSGAIWVRLRPLQWGNSQWEWAYPKWYRRWTRSKRS